MQALHVTNDDARAATYMIIYSTVAPITVLFSFKKKLKKRIEINRDCCYVCRRVKRWASSSNKRICTHLHIFDCTDDIFSNIFKRKSAD